MKLFITTITVLTATLASAATLYLEDFSNTSTGTNFNNAWNWGNADAQLTSLVVDGVGIRTEGWSQSSIGATAVGNTPVAGALTEMGVPFTPFNGGTSRLMYTLEVASLGLTVSDVKTFQMDLRKRAAANRVWFGILTGNKWYFTQNTLMPTVDDEAGDPDYYRYRVPVDRMIEINQVWDGGTGWGVDRTTFSEDIVGPANLTGSEGIEGFAILFTTWNSVIGNMYIDNLAMTDEAVPASYVPELVVESPGAPDLEVTFDSVAGVNYQLERSLDGMANWEFVGDPLEATGTSLTFTDTDAQPAVGEKVFYRVSVAAYKIP